jgi:hypothetical protein
MELNDVLFTFDGLYPIKHIDIFKVTLQLIDRAEVVDGSDA